ncbi:uncharacterized protein KQ657_000412 [Scheffersomyces spartinae]|uniref:Uncharacterized protein n=1 Tax=Scheffersomyces spartinae TaxID=45513 RepID=A0A9P8AHU1_9ASCO|nr:uncharacterized protein KQ657_000412 [Scheffersomyces spartinae]KAG7193722.1 hypothetical protein KQ657_000412 [Scheffersomyces spartinae]
MVDLTEIDKVLETAQDSSGSPLSPINPIEKRLSIDSFSSNDNALCTSRRRSSVDGWSQSTAGAPPHVHSKHHRCNSTAIKFNTPKYC